MKETVAEMELGNSIGCFLARSAAYLDVPAGPDMACGGQPQGAAPADSALRQGTET